MAAETLCKAAVAYENRVSQGLSTRPSSPVTTGISPTSAPLSGPAPKRGRGWLNFSNLKVEAALFLLIALTFAAVLGQSAVTTKEIVLTPHSGQYLTYSYTDSNTGGTSWVHTEPARALAWACGLKPVIKYPYCGYALKLDTANKGVGADFSKYRDIHIRLNYHGVGDHMRLVVKVRPPASLRDRVKDDTMPITAEFGVAQGLNDIHLTRDQLDPEQWWIAAHNLNPDDAHAILDNVISIEFVSGNLTPAGRFDAEVQSIGFKGAYLSTEQWYLIILGAWLVLTAGFLIYRFRGMRHAYEARRRRDAEEAEVLGRARAAAEAASAAKSQFLANMSHELRTPLNAILGYAQLLKTGNLDEGQRTAVTTIQSSGDHLLTMITDILDIAKVEAGKLELLPGAFDLRACVETVAAMVRLRAEEKGLTFHVAIAPDVPQSVTGDAKRLRQVLINLLGNAIKFTTSGTIRLDVACAARDDAHVHLCFAVHDSGVGIAPDQIGRIFRPFEQAGNAIDRSSGTGLGLAITHEIVRMMGGAITVDSQPGQGSCFTVNVPFTPVAEAAPALPAPELAAVTDTTELAENLAPDSETLARLLDLARAGNLRAIRKEIPAIRALGPQYHGFAERLDALAAAYQSPAVLRLIEQHAQERTAA